MDCRSAGEIENTLLSSVFVKGRDNDIPHSDQMCCSLCRLWPTYKLGHWWYGMDVKSVPHINIVQHVDAVHCEFMNLNSELCSGEILNKVFKQESR